MAMRESDFLARLQSVVGEDDEEEEYTAPDLGGFSLERLREQVVRRPGPMSSAVDRTMERFAPPDLFGEPEIGPRRGTIPAPVPEPTPEPEPAPEPRRDTGPMFAVDRDAPRTQVGPGDPIPEPKPSIEDRFAAGFTGQIPDTEQARAERAERQERWFGELDPDVTLGQRVVGAARNFARQVPEMGAAGLEGLGVLAKELDELTGTGQYDGMTAEELATSRLGQKLREVGETLFPRDPELQGRFFEDVLPSGFGSALAFFGGGVAGRVAGAPRMLVPGVGGALAEGGGTYREALSFGAEDPEARGAALKAMPLGALEAIPAEQAVGRLMGAMRRSGSSRPIIDALIAGGLEEQAQEVAQTIGGNWIAQNSFDPERELFDGVPEAAATALIVGSTVSGGAAAVGEVTRGAEEGGYGARFREALEPDTPPVAEAVESGGFADRLRQVIEAETEPEAAPAPAVAQEEEPAPATGERPPFIERLGNAYRALGGEEPPATTAPEGAAPAVEHGTASEVELADGRTLPVEYAIVDAGQTRISHDPVTFQPRADFPEGAQDRRYHADTAAQEEVAGQAANLRPELLLDPTRTATDGPAILTQDGIALSGNQRTMMILRAKEQHPERYQAYVDDLVNRAGEFGLDPQEAIRTIESMLEQGQVPALGRVLTGTQPQSTEEMASIMAAANETAMKSRDPLGEAAVMAGRLREADAPLRFFSETIEPNQTIRQYLDTGSGREFIQGLVQNGVIPRNQASRYMNAQDARATQEGKQLVERMLLAAAVQDADTVDRAPAGWVRKIEKAVPAILETQAGEGWDLSPVIREALELGTAIDRSEGVRDVESFVSQTDLEGRQFSPAAEALARLLEGANQNRVAEALRDYASLAQEARQRAGSEDLFGEAPPTPAEVFSEIFGAEMEPGELAPAPQGDPDTYADLEVQDDMFGGPAEMRGEEQRGLFTEEETRQSLEDQEAQARSTVERLRPLIENDAATDAQRDQYREALALIRRDEAQSEEEVTLRRPEEADEPDPFTGDLFGDVEPEGEFSVERLAELRAERDATDTPETTRPEATAEAATPGRGGDGSTVEESIGGEVGEVNALPENQSDRLEMIEQDDLFRESFPDGEASPLDQQSLPEGITPPEDFGVNIMEAGRLLAASPRYKKIRGRMMGFFSALGRVATIGVENVRWVKTMAHEVGHAIDYRLNGDKFPSSIKKRFPSLQIGERAARDELRRASEYLRPLPDGRAWGDKSAHMKYRAMHQELMADLYALYMFDADRARELAPNVTEALEEAVANNPLVRTAIEAVTNPEKAPSASRVDMSERQTTLPEKPDPVLSEADPQIRAEAFEAVEQMLREFQSRLARAQALARQWRETLTEDQRSDIAAFVEGIGRVDIDGDTLTDVEGRMTPPMRRVAREYRYHQELNRQEANKLFEEAGAGPEYINYVADYIAHIYQLDRKKTAQFVGKWRKSTPHSMKRTHPTLKEAVEAGLTPLTLDVAYLFEKTAENNFRAAATRRFAKQISEMRTLDGDPIMAGPDQERGADWVKIDHPVLRHTYARPLPDGTMALGESNAWVHPSVARPLQVVLQKPFDGPIAKTTTLLNSVGKALNVAFSMFHEFALFESSSAVNMRFLNPLRGVLIGPWEARRLGLSFRPYLTYKAGTELQRDPDGVEDATRHGLALGHSASADYARTFMDRLLRGIEARAPRLGGAAAGAAVGFRVGMGATGTLAGAATPIPVLRRLAALTGGVGGGVVGAAGGGLVGAAVGTKKVRQAYDLYQRHLWDNVHSGLKLHAYHSLVAEIVPNAPPGFSVRDVKEIVASHVNDAFGGQETIQLPTLQKGHLSLAEPATVQQVQAMHWALLAPDWTTSNIRIAGRTITQVNNPVARKLGVRYWRNMTVGLYLMPILAQFGVYALFSDDDDDLEKNPWDNEPDRRGDIDVTAIRRRINALFGVEDDGRRHYVRIGKQAKEVMRYFEEPPTGLIENLGAKSSVVVRSFVEQATGHAVGSGFAAPWTETAFERGLEGYENIAARGVAFGEHFMPFSFGSNNFAFSLPERLGMSKYRAVRHYEDAIKAWSDPNWWEKGTEAMRGTTPEQRERATRDIIDDVDEALRKNGLSDDERKQVWNSAMSQVRSEYYQDFFGAIEEEQFDEAEEAAGVLQSLGADQNGFESAARGRQLELGPAHEEAIEGGDQGGTRAPELAEGVVPGIAPPPTPLRPP